MKNGFIRVASCSPDLRVADVSYNTEKIIEAIFAANDHGAAIVCFPELCITGSTCADLFAFDSLLDSAKKALIEIKNKTADLDIISVVGLPILFEGLVYNAAAVIYKGSILGLPLKTAAPEYDEFYEGRYFSSGANVKNAFINADSEQMPIIPIGSDIIFRCSNKDSFSFAVSIGTPLVSTDSALSLCKNGANIILSPTAKSDTVGVCDRVRTAVLSQSEFLSCGYVLSNAGMGESTTDSVFSGQGIIAECGELLSERLPFDGGMIISEIDVDHIAFERRRRKTYTGKTAARSIYFGMTLKNTALTRHFSAHPFLSEDEKQAQTDCEHILTIQSYALKKRLECSYTQKAVIGISGGLDSCLALLVCARTMKLIGRPMTDTVAVSMPCFGTTSRTKSNAQLLSEALGVDFREIDISKTVGAHLSDIGHNGQPDTAFENAQARERTQVIMDICNMENGLVVGTGDLSEVALGWSTYNGDHMSMYGVNASIPKTLIRRMIKHCADSDESIKAVLYDVLDTPVSPELLPDDNDKIVQKTEDIVGPYELHDFFLYNFIKKGCSPEKLFVMAKQTFGGKYDGETILKWLRSFFKRFFSQQFKRSCSPDAPAVGDVSLSPRSGWKMASDSANVEWMKSLDAIEPEQ